MRIGLAAALVAAAIAGTQLIGAAAAKEDTLAGSAAAGGVTVDSSPYRYVAISPSTRPALTVVERIDLAGGRVDRWWYLHGRWMIPAGAFDLGGTGLSADEGTLLLSAFSNGRYTAAGDHMEPPRTTRLAVLDTRLHLRHPSRQAGRPRHAISHVTLRGTLEVNAVSPDGSTAFLAHYPGGHGLSFDRPGQGRFQVRALNLASGRLSPAPARGRDRRVIPLAGVPVDRTSSRDGRWSYALYYGVTREPFLLAIDTVAGTISRVDLPHLRYGRDPFGLRLSLSTDGRSLAVFHRNLSERGHSSPQARVPLPIPASAEPPPRRHGRLGFLFTPRHPGNLMGRSGIAGHSAAGRAIRARQWGDPARRATLVFGCIHGDECAARRLEPRFVLSGGCPDPNANLIFVPDLDPDGFRAGTRLNGNEVDLNRNFPAFWRPIGLPGSPQYSGPRPFSEPESRLAARIIRTLAPRQTIWFHQHGAPGAFVRGWGQSAPAGRRFARLAGIPFHLLEWPAGTAPNWQNHAFPGSGSFVVELPLGELTESLDQRLGEALARTAHEVGEDGPVAQKG
jgi:protein MpaA